MKSTRSLLLLAAVAVAPLAITASYVSAQGAPPQGGPPAGRGGGPPGGDMGKELLDGLKATKGCLGVETAFTSTRKSVIFAWFEDKAATLRWYESDTHQTLMMGMTEGGEEREPMANVPDGVPVMCIATITPSQKPMIPGFPVPISQVSIELYTPLPGGIAVNGRFSPEGLKVEHLVEQKLEAPPAAPAGGDGKGSGS